jgi:polyketide cyclase/dehydrase/lipid transport protein
MSQPIHIRAQRHVAAPAAVVYRCLADYQQHHRPGGFLPPAFTALEVERGGVGDGTVIRFSTRLGGATRHGRHEVSEPEPGRVLMEAGPDAATTFTVDPAGPGACDVRIDTQLQVSDGLRGVLERLFAPRMLRPLYADELARLERRAQQVAADAQ